MKFKSNMCGVVVAAAALLLAPALQAEDWRAGRLEDLNQVLIWQLQGRAEVDGPHVSQRLDAPPVEYRWRCIAPEREPCALPSDAPRIGAAL